MKTISLLWLLAFVAGALFAVAGAASAVVVLLVRGQVPPAAALSAAPWWSYLGGVIVAFYVFTITFLAPLGVGTAISLIVTGQIVAALTIDDFGLLRSPVFPLTP